MALIVKIAKRIRKGRFEASGKQRASKINSMFSKFESILIPMHMNLFLRIAIVTGFAPITE